MPDMMRRPYKDSVLVLLISLLLALFVGRNFILFKGYVYFAENFEVYKVQDFFRIFYPIWNENLQIFILEGLPKLYLYAPISSIAEMLNSYKLLQIILLLAPYPIGFLSAFKLSRNITRKFIKQRISEKFLNLSSILAAFVFIANPWFMMVPLRIILRLQYAFLPMIVYLFIRLLEEKNARFSILFAMAMALTGSYRFTLVVALLLAIVFLSYVISSSKGDWKECVSKLGWISLACALFALLSLAKFLPGILYSRIVPLRAVEQFTLDMIQRETLLHIFTTKIYEWTASGLDITYSDMAHFVFLPVSAFAFTYLLFLHKIPQKRKRYSFLTFPTLPFLLFVLLAAKELNVDVLFVNLPFSDFLGRLLRHAQWNIMPLVVSISVMLGLSTACLLSRIKSRAYPLLLAILILTCISVWPMFTGDMNGFWRPAEPPRDYIEVNSLLRAHEGDNHALWLPHLVRRAVWSNQRGASETSAPTGIFPIRSSAKPSYSTWQYYFFDYYNPLRGGPGMSPLPVYEGDLSEIYSPMNVKYLILHYDGSWLASDYRKGFTNSYITSIANEIANLSSVHELYRGDYLSAFEFQNDAREFEVREPVLVMDRLTALGSIAASFEGKMPAIIFGTSIDMLGKYILDFSSVITSTEELLPLAKNAIIVPPKSSSEKSAPEQTWSPSSVDDQLFQDFLWRNEIEWNWDFDYGKGLIFTLAASTLNEKPAPENNDLIENWTFDSTGDLYRWKNYTHENQFGTLYSLTLDNNALKAELWNSTWGWKTINSPLISAEYGNWYRWELQIKGENVHKAHLKIIEYDEEKKMVNAHHVKSIGSGNFDWNNIAVDFTPESPETKYLQFQVWHGSETEQSLPNIIWIDDVKVYDLQRFVEPVTLEIPFTTQEIGDHVFLIRYFENQKGGKIEIQLDNTQHTISTKDQLNKFVWKEIDTLNLEKGQHKITVTNLQGFNAINLFAIIPKQQHQNAQNQLELTLQTKRIIHILEAESDLYHQNAIISNEYDEGASNGHILTLNQNSTVWQNITIAKTDNYKLTVKSKGKLQIQIDDQAYTTNSTSLNWNHLNMTHLNKGNHKIQITTPTNAELDAIWLYSTQNPKEDLQDIFATKQKPAQIANYTKIDPTKYTINVNSTQPFMLSFAEAYDPLWIAYVNGERIESMPLYSVINGFWINQTGQLEITIEYEPQKWFNCGLVISATTFLACLAYLTYSWCTRIKAIWKRMRARA